MNYKFPTSNGAEVEELNSYVFANLMNLGLPIKRGTIELKNVIIFGILNADDDLTFTSSLKLYCKENNLNFAVVKSNIFKATYSINQTRFKNNFYKIFNYESDLSFTTPMNLYECFVALRQIQK